VDFDRALLLPLRWCSGRRAAWDVTRRDCSARPSISWSASPLAERGANPLRVVADLNARLTHTACIYALKPDVRARTVRFEKNIAANHDTYSIYQVQVTAHGTQKTEIGDIAFTFSPPLTMYTLRAAAPAQTVSH
jgi:hypothetical protein